MTKALTSAIDYAKKGWYVFPIMPDSKHPYAEFKWKKQSTKNVSVIKKAGESSLYKDCNWALDCGRSGILVLDVDCKHGKNGFHSLAKLKLPPAGFTVQTPSGGLHCYYSGKGPNSASKIDSGLDTRGVGGYVLIPGSVIAGKFYTLNKNDPPSPIPELLTQKIGRSVEPKKPSTASTEIEFDQKHHIKTAIDYLTNEAPEATFGSGSDTTTYGVACYLRDLGISQDKALFLLLDYWNDQKSFPPWPPDKLERKVQNAYNYAQNFPGNKTPEVLFPDPVRSTGAIRCASDISINKLTPRQWLMGYRYLPGYVTVTIAPGGVGKSTLTILEGLSLSSGKKLTYDDPVKSAPVWLYNTEDPFDELDRRVMAAAKHHYLTKDDIRNFYYSSGQETPFKLVIEEKGKLIVAENVVNSIIKEIDRRKIKLFIVDPFVRCHGVNENDNNAVDLVVQQFTRIAQATGCAVSLVHHARKGSTKNPRGDMDAARGASALVFAARIAHTLYDMNAKEAKEYGIPKPRRKWFVRLDDAKANLSPPRGKASWFEKKSVALFFDSNETTGTIEPTSIERVVAENTDEAIVEAVVSLVGINGNRSLYALAKEIQETGIIPGTIKTIQNKIEINFISALKTDKALFYLGKTSSKNGGMVKSVKSSARQKD